MKKIFFSSIACLVLAGLFAFTLVQRWHPTDKYNIGFSSNDAGGIFKKFSGNIVFDDQNPAASSFDVTIDVASINTGNALQNKHAKSDEWFDVAKYPVAKYVSKKITKTATGFQVVGDLDLHGVKKEVAIPFSFRKSGNTGEFKGSFTVNRSDFRIGKPGGDVGEQIKVDVTVPVTKK
ncbi:MAG: YceI family protein [Bacteroidetes bacterium]|nr:YceI family protein [Bacteroidota bacterium]